MKPESEELVKDDIYSRFMDKKAMDILMNAPVLFGLKQQGHLPTIERMLKDGATWEEIGKEIGWCPETAKEHYGWYKKGDKNE